MRIYLVVLVTALLSTRNAVASSMNDTTNTTTTIERKAKEGFALKRDCIWNRPVNCSPKDSLSSSFQIDLHVIKGDSYWEKENGFPPELKQAARVAANTWLRVIRGRHGGRRARPSDMMDLREACGIGDGELTKVGDLVICLELVVDVSSDEDFLARVLLPSSRQEPFPRAVTLEINSVHAGRFYQCDWNNVMLHEVAHALGFGIPVFSALDLAYSSSNGLTTFTGKNAKHEWEAMGGSKNRNRYPLLSEKDGSHWPKTCFLSPEIMKPYLRKAQPKVIFGHDTRQPMSRLTLAVFQDLGYDVDMNCADRGINITEIADDRCAAGGRGRRFRKFKSTKKTKHYSPGAKVWSLFQKRAQIVRYRVLQDLATCRKQIRRYGQALKKICQQVTKKRWFPKCAQEVPQAL